MSQKTSVETIDLADEILRYLEKHEHAADTIEGIAKWWVAQQRIDEEISKVEQALAYLCQVRVIVKRELSDGSTIYFYKKDARKDIDA